MPDYSSSLNSPSRYTDSILFQCSTALCIGNEIIAGNLKFNSPVFYAIYYVIIYLIRHVLYEQD